jgi:RNA polymerase sigma factor (sigma-70 family)
MNEVTDNDLLAQFVQSESDEAFTRIVERYINLVHSVALRHTANPDYAEEITQAVFIILARRARSLDRKTILCGWLFQTARLTSANFIRSVMRRLKREQEAFVQSSTEAQASEEVWAELLPLLDDAMGRLRTTDRDALVLRYFENKSLREVGLALGIEERAAQKRVGRGIEKLRGLFARRGVVASAAIIVTGISSHSVQAAPHGLASRIAVAALKGSAAAGSTLTLVKGTLHLMTLLKAKTAAVYSAVALLAAGATLAIAHHGRPDENQGRALQEKLEAERQGGFANVSTDPNAEKLEAEKKELEQKAMRQQQQSQR